MVSRSLSVSARMNFGMALAKGKIQGVKVDPAQFGVTVDASRIERSILGTDASPEAKDAIATGLRKRCESSVDRVLPIFYSASQDCVTAALKEFRR